MLDRQEYVSGRSVGIVGFQGPLLGIIRELGFIVQNMVADHGMNLDFAQEPTSGLDHAEKKHGYRHADCRVNAVLNTRENRDQNPCEENENLQRRDTPELIYSIRRSDEVSDGMYNNRRKRCVGYVEEDGG